MAFVLPDCIICRPIAGAIQTKPNNEDPTLKEQIMFSLLPPKLQRRVLVPTNARKMLQLAIANINHKLSALRQSAATTSNLSDSSAVIAPRMRNHKAQRSSSLACPETQTRRLSPRPCTTGYRRRDWRRRLHHSLPTFLILDELSHREDGTASAHGDGHMGQSKSVVYQPKMVQDRVLVNC